MRYSFMLIGLMCVSSYVLYSADTTDISIMPYKPEFLKQVLNLLNTNIESIMPHSSNNLTEHRERMPYILQAIDNAVTMIKPIGHTNHKEGSFERRILLDEEKVVGLLDFFVQKADNKGYIHVAHTQAGYEKYKPKLIEAACAHLKEQKDVKSVLTHVRNNGEDYDECMEKMLQSLHFSKAHEQDKGAQFGVVYFERMLEPHDTK